MKINLYTNTYEYTFETEIQEDFNRAVTIDLNSLANRICEYYTKSSPWAGGVARTGEIRNLFYENNHFFWAKTQNNIGKDIGIFKVYISRVK